MNHERELLRMIESIGTDLLEKDAERILARAFNLLVIRLGVKIKTTYVATAAFDQGCIEKHPATDGAGRIRSIPTNPATHAANGKPL